MEGGSSGSVDVGVGQQFRKLAGRGAGGAGKVAEKAAGADGLAI